MRALVLRRTPYGETDLIIQFFLENGLRVSGFARGARRSKKRFPHQFDPAGLYQLDDEIFRGPGSERGMLTLRSAELVSYPFSLTRQIRFLTRWLAVLEWILIDEEGRFDFSGLIELRQALEQNQLDSYVRFFIGQWRDHGVTPSFSVCAHCHANREATEVSIFSCLAGGLVHEACARSEEEIYFLSAEEVTGIKMLLDEFAHQTDEVASERPIASTLKNAEVLDQILMGFLEYQFGRRLKTRHFLATTNYTKAFLGQFS